MLRGRRESQTVNSQRVIPVMCAIVHGVTFSGTGMVKNGWRGEVAGRQGRLPIERGK
jgi:hypothetical protein